jgi:hypothetical protein
LTEDDKVDKDDASDFQLLSVVVDQVRSSITRFRERHRVQALPGPGQGACFDSVPACTGLGFGFGHSSLMAS